MATTVLRNGNDRLRKGNLRQRHLRAVIASQEYKGQYCEEKIRMWKEEIERLSEIAKSQPHTAYIAFTKGYKT